MFDDFVSWTVLGMCVKDKIAIFVLTIQYVLVYTGLALLRLPDSQIQRGGMTTLEGEGDGHSHR